MEDISFDKYQESMPHIVKSCKEILVLSMILEHPMSGYDLIKNIFLKTEVLLSQGAIYPILYLFEEAGVLQAEYAKGDMRAKIYHLTPQGRKIAQNKIDQYLQAFDHFVALIDPEVTYPRIGHMNNDPALDLRLDFDGNKSSIVTTQVQGLE